MEPARVALARTRAGRFIVNAATITGMTRGWVRNPRGSSRGLGTGWVLIPSSAARSERLRELDCPVRTARMEERMSVVWAAEVVVLGVSRPSRLLSKFSSPAEVVVAVVVASGVVVSPPPNIPPITSIILPVVVAVVVVVVVVVGFNSPKMNLLSAWDGERAREPWRRRSRFMQFMAIILAQVNPREGLQAYKA